MEKKSKQANVIFVLIILFTLIATIVSPMTYRITGDSMLPTYKDKQLVLINYFSLNKEYKKDDILVFDYNGQKFIKRVIGVAGDHIVVKGYDIYINDIKIEEEYILEPTMLKDLDFIVPKDSYFVLGDNRDHSVDSRDIGLINKQNIEGKVIYEF